MMNIEPQNIEGRYSIFLITEMVERHAAQAPALRERFNPSTFEIHYSKFDIQIHLH
jgi:hypothetical protein